MRVVGRLVLASLLAGSAFVALGSVSSQFSRDLVVVAAPAPHGPPTIAPMADAGVELAMAGAPVVQQVSIRRKLFYAFIGVVAVPLTIAVVLARQYLAREQAVLDQRFIEQTRAALARMNEQARQRLEALRKDVHEAAVDYDPDETELSIHVVAPPRVSLPLEDGLEGVRPVRPPEAPSLSVALAARMPERVRELCKKDPEIIGVRVLDQGRVVYSDLKDDEELSKFAWPVAGPGTADDRTLELTCGRQLVLARVLDEDDGRELIVEVDPRLLRAPQAVSPSGVVFFVKPGTAEPFHAPYEVWPTCEASERLEETVKFPLAALGGELPAAGELKSVRDLNWVRWRVYTGLATETEPLHFADGSRLLAMVREDELFAPLTRFRVEVYGALFASLLVAAWLAYFLSGRLVGAVDRIRSGVEALSRGEWAQLDKLSEDELGGGLVESVNHMAKALAERTRKEEIEGWRRLVRVLSHEINNTLAPVRSVAVTVRDQIAGRVDQADAAEDLRMAFQLIVDRTDALTSFIANYAELAKLPDPVRADADLNVLVGGAARLFSGDAEKAGVALRVELDPEVPRVRVDAGQVERVVINLVKNALEAAPEGGEVLVATARRGPSVEVTVDDNGPGIALEARRHLFVPYFTTKPGGSGIGLALVRQIVLGHGGTVTAEDRPGGGTRARVLLPLQGDSRAT